MATITAIIEGSTVVEDQNGLTIVERIHVSGLSGQYVLLQAKANCGVAYGQAHPEATPQVFAQRIEPKPFGNSRTEAWVDVTYKPPNFGDIINDTLVRFHGTTRPVRTAVFDRDGEPIVAKYTSGEPPNEIEHKPQVVMITDDKAYGILTFDRFSFSLPNNALSLLNRLNASAWNGGAPFTWWCRDIQFEKMLYRSGYREHYAFEYDPETHIKSAVWRNIHGDIPEDIDDNPDRTVLEGNGWVNPRTKYTGNFNILGLPAVF
jgi:hypothetical protein